MDVQKRQSIIERIQEQSSFTVFQPAFFSSSFEPESLEDFDFESAPMNHLPTTKEDDEQDPIHQSSGLTSNSNVTSYASTAPILQQQQQQPYSKHNQTLTTATEEYNLQALDTKRASMNDATTESETESAAAAEATTTTAAAAEDSQETLNSKHVPSQHQHEQKPCYVLKNQPYRNYQIFPGHTRFLLGGRLVTSRDYRAFIAALFILISPTVLFAIFTCPFLWNQVHPALPIVFAYLFVLAFVSMLKTSWTDPGIIPRNLDPIAQDIMDESASVDSEEAPPKEIWIKNTAYSLKYCDTCMIYRPPRASHCRQCNNCVEFEDHHCAWLNNCVGKRNYRSFFTFITSSALLCVFVICSGVYQLLFISRNQEQQPTSFGEVFSKAPVSFVLCIYCFVLLWLVGGLTLYHCSLVLRGVTTHEQIRADIIRAKYPELRANPYSKSSPLKNMIQVLCQPQPKSYLRRRKMADPVIEKLS
ncbi:Eukaryotic peptide chain release factor GTP-binding subunit [Mucor circinelloides]